MIDLRAATPPVIDAALAELDYERFAAMVRKIDLWQAADKARNHIHYDWRTRVKTPRPDLERAAELEALAVEQAAIEEAKLDEMAPYIAEFQRRGGWTRAFLVVTNGDGHVHRSQACHTCYPTTQFHWVTDFSGHDEAEIVDAAGERACTICYPTAPAEVLNRPTAIFSKDEEAKRAAREEREAKRAAKAALEVIDPVTGKTLFKTERGATNEIASHLDAYARYENDEYLEKAKKIVAAVAAKRGTDPADLLDELLAKATAKFRKEAIKQITQLRQGPKGLHYDQTDPANWHASYRRIAEEEGLIASTPALAKKLH
jgi:hypothetical protein